MLDGCEVREKTPNRTRKSDKHKKGKDIKVKKRFPASVFKTEEEMDESHLPVLAAVGLVW